MYGGGGQKTGVVRGGLGVMVTSSIDRFAGGYRGILADCNVRMSIINGSNLGTISTIGARGPSVLLDRVFVAGLSVLNILSTVNGVRGRSTPLIVTVSKFTGPQLRGRILGTKTYCCFLGPFSVGAVTREVVGLSN